MYSDTAFLKNAQTKFAKNLFLIALVLGLCFVPAFAQKTKEPPKLSETQWDDLFKSLSEEDWNTAFKLSTKYLEQLKNDDNAEDIGNLRYICLYSAAGRVSEGKMSYDELEKFVKDFEGKKLIAPFRRIKNDCKGALNYICVSDGSKRKALVSATNQNGTTILAFEYLDLKEDFDFAKNDGKQAAVFGIAKSIVPNPNRSNILILRIYFSDASIVLADDIKAKKQDETPQK